jgi:hypothetical protein
LGKNQGAAVDFMDYLLSEANMTEFWKAGTIVTYQFQTVPPAPSDLQADVYAAMQATLPGYYMDVPNAEVATVLWASEQSVVGHKISVEQALAAIQKVYSKQAAKVAASPAPSPSN